MTQFIPVAALPIRVHDPRAPLTKGAVLALGLMEGSEAAALAESPWLPARAIGLIGEALQRGDFSGKIEETLLLVTAEGQRLLLVGLGKPASQPDAALRAYRRAIRAGAAFLARLQTPCAALALPAQAALLSVDAEAALRHAAEQTDAALYRFDHFRQEPAPAFRAEELVLIPAASLTLAEAEAAVAEGLAVADGVRLARELGNLPGNVCTPSRLAETAVALAAHHTGLECTVLERDEMAALGMGALLAVAQGSRQPPKLIVLRWQGGPDDEPPLALVGKGVTFDSGGISLKPGEKMDEMKYDMAGAAAVLGTLHAAATLGLPRHVLGIIPAVENMPDGIAVKPGDIVRAMNGKHIEILNTDAEGRLILADALCYAQTLKPRAVIDLATLTGACVVALGREPHGLFASDDALAAALLAAGQAAFDRAWRLPLWPEYAELLKSNFADLANIGGREGGAISAALFLKQFVDDALPWAHLDIAGTAWVTGDKKGATGRPVPLLLRWLLEMTT